MIQAQRFRGEFNECVENLAIGPNEKVGGTMSNTHSGT
jgi:hypothetical protein